MSFQAYLDAVEMQTMSHVIRGGPGNGDKHVGTTGSHRDESNTLWLDGIANR